MATTNERHAFVIRGRCDETLDIKMFRAFKFNFEHGGTRVYKVEGNDDIDMSYDVNDDQYVIVLDNLPFAIVNEKVALTDIIFDISHCVSYFRFIVDSFECTERSTICTIEPTYIGSFWGIAKDTNEEEKEQYVSGEEVLFYFYVRTNLNEKYLQCIKNLQFTDVKHPGEDYDFIIRHLVVEDLNDGNDGKLLNCYGHLWRNKNNKPIINIGFIHLPDYYLKLKGIRMEDAEGNPITEEQPSHKGFIDTEMVRFGKTVMPWIGDMMDQCEPGSLYLDIVTDVNHDEFVEQLDDLLLTDHGKKYWFVLGKDSKKVLADSGMTLLLQVKGQLADATYQKMDNSHIADEESDFKLSEIDLNMDLTGKHLRIRKIVYVDQPKKPGTVIPVDFSNARQKKKEGLVIDVVSDLSNSQIIACLDSISFISKRDNSRFRIRLVECTIKDRKNKCVSIKVTKYLTLAECPILSLPVDLSNASNYAWYGYCTVTGCDPLMIVVKSVQYNGRTIEHIGLGPNNFNPSNQLPSYYCWPTIELIVLVKNADETPLKSMNKISMELDGYKYTVKSLNIIVVSSHPDDETHFRVYLRIVPSKFEDEHGEEVQLNGPYGYNNRLLSVELGESVCEDIEFTLVKAYIRGREMTIGRNASVVYKTKATKKEEPQVELSREVSINMKVVERLPHVEFYQVRGIDVDEGTNLKVKAITNTMYYEHNGLDITQVDSTNVCSELVVAKGCDIDTVVILDGGSVYVEEGGHIGKVYVHTGGLLEVCSGGKVDLVYELGGAAWGCVDKFAASKLWCEGEEKGYTAIRKDQYCTLHEGTVMWDVEVEGRVETHDNTYATGLTIRGDLDICGGYVENIEVVGGTIFFTSGVAMDIHADRNSRVVIMRGAKLFNCKFDCDVDYAGDDWWNDPNHVNVHVASDHTVRCISLDGVKDEVEIENDSEKE